MPRRSAVIPTAAGWRRCWPRSGFWRASRSTTRWSDGSADEHGAAEQGADGGEQGEGPQAAAAGQGLGPAGGRGGGVVRLRWVGRPGRGRSGGAGVGGDRGGGVPVGAAGRAGAGERECAAGGRGRGR